MVPPMNSILATWRRGGGKSEKKRQVGRTPSGPRVGGARKSFFKNFVLYINVLRIRFGVETTLADG